MNQRAAKKTRREMRRYFRRAGLAPEDLAARFALQLRPRPWWMPAPAWRALVRRVVRDPGASTGAGGVGYRTPLHGG